MAAENALHRPLTEDEMRQQTCSEAGDTSHEQAKDYSPYAIFITSYTGVLVLLYVVFFNPEMKRSNADRMLTGVDQEANFTASTSNNDSEPKFKNDLIVQGPIQEVQQTTSQALLPSSRCTNSNHNVMINVESEQR